MSEIKVLSAEEFAEHFCDLQCVSVEDEVVLVTLVKSRDASIRSDERERCAQIVGSCQLVKDTIGPLYGVGWKSAITIAAKNLRSLPPAPGEG